MNLTDNSFFQLTQLQSTSSTIIGNSSKLLDNIEVFSSVYAHTRNVKEASLMCQTYGGLDVSDGNMTGLNIINDSRKAGVEAGINDESKKQRDSLTYENNMSFSGKSDGEQHHLGAKIATLSAQLGEGFKNMARILLNSPDVGETNISVSIKLEGIGEIRLDVHMVKKDVFVVAYGANSHVAEILSLGISDLKNRLEHSGLRLAQIKVITPE